MEILWIALGTKDEYEAEYGDKPFGEKHIFENRFKNV